VTFIATPDLGDSVAIVVGDRGVLHRDDADRHGHTVADGAERRRASIAVPSSTRLATCAIVTARWCSLVALWFLHVLGGASCSRGVPRARRPAGSGAVGRSVGLSVVMPTRPGRAPPPAARLDGGESIKALSEYLGHADPGFTLRTYTHLMPTSHERTRRGGGNQNW
jgi:hypothetical protein